MLDADAQAIIDEVQPLISPQPIHVQGVAETRRRIAALAPPPALPDIHAVEDRTVPGPAGDIPIRIYRPRGGGDLPALVWLHGGAFVLGDLEMSDIPARLMAAGGECLVVSVDYRLAPEHRFPAAFEDGLAVLDWVAAQAADLGVDPNRLAVGGDSAGAAIAASLAVHARDRGGPPLALQLLVYGFFDYPDEDSPSYLRFLDDGPWIVSRDIPFGLDLYLRDGDDRQDPRACAGATASFAGVAPAVVVTADHDPLLDHLEASVNRLTADGVDVVHLAYTGVFHGFFSFPGAIAKATTAHEDVAARLRAAFAPVGQVAR